MYAKKYILREKWRPKMKISELIPKEKIIAELKSQSKDEIIDELLNLFKDDERVYDIDVLREDIIKREKIMSTGIGEGLAIPHCSTNVVNGYIVAFGKTGKPVDFESIDHKPAFFFFLVAGNNVKRHMQFLSRVARVMNKEFKEKLLNANTSDEIYSFFQKFDDEVIRPKYS